MMKNHMRSSFIQKKVLILGKKSINDENSRNGLELRHRIV